METVWLLVLQHIKPLAVVGFVAVDVEYVPVESTVIKLPFPSKGGLLCQIKNGLKLKYKYFYRSTPILRFHLHLKYSVRSI